MFFNSELFMNILKYIRKKKHILFKRKLKEKIAKEASLFISYIDFLLFIIILNLLIIS